MEKLDKKFIRYLKKEVSIKLFFMNVDPINRD